MLLHQSSRHSKDPTHYLLRLSTVVAAAAVDDAAVSVQQGMYCDKAGGGAAETAYAAAEAALEERLQRLKSDNAELRRTVEEQGRLINDMRGQLHTKSDGI